jgi:predicted nucleic acid-binding protein
MTARVFVDTNLLIYSLDPGDPLKRSASADLLRETIRTRTLTLSPQSLNECYRVLTQRRRVMPVADARSFISMLAPWAIAPLTAETTQRAFLVQDEIGAGWWDSLMLASAALAKCRIFFSEDLQDGRAIGEMRIVNPFVRASTKRG